MRLIATKTESSVVRSLCSGDNKVAGTLLAGLDSDFFYNDYTQAIYKRTLEITRESGEIPKWRQLIDDPELNEEVRIKMKAMQPERIQTRVDAIQALNTLNKYRQMRGALELSDKIVNDLKGSKVVAGDVLDMIGKETAALRMTKNVKNAVLTFGKGNNSAAMVKEFLDPDAPANFIPTGFDTFDKENGGFTLGSLVTLGGTTGAGKSALASQLCINWTLMGYSVTLVPLEMSKSEMTARIMANVSDIDARKIIFRRMSEGEKEKYKKAYIRFVKKSKAAKGSYHIFKPDQDMTIEEVMASLYPLNSDVVVVDYISLLKGVDGDDSWQKLGAVARYCKIWAENNNKIVVLLCQVNEEGKIRYSGAIAEHSSYSWIFVANKATRENQILSVEQLKARNGSMFPFVLKTNLETMRIRDMDIDEQQELESISSSRSKASRKHTASGDKFRKKKPKEDYLNDVSSAEED